MRNPSHQKLLTCRYWALGPRCPDIGPDKIQTCPFAHWDTGKLARFQDQRGTCFDWYYNGRCSFGAGCIDEHRETGVMGLNQGMLVLHGLNLDVADAASKAGFNTRDRIALTELIWSVRRVACRYSGGGIRLVRPPLHPIYPDRYRPYDPSDNTNKKRKRWKALEVESPVMEIADDLLKFGPEDTQDRQSMCPLNSPARDPEAAMNSEAHYSIELKLPERPKNSIRPFLPEGQEATSISPCTEVSNGALSSTVCEPLAPRPRDLLSPTPVAMGPGFGGFATIGPPAPQDATIKRLDQVRASLRENISALLSCSNAMKLTYDTDDRLCEDAIYPELAVLKKTFDCGIRDAENGIKAVDRVIKSLQTTSS